MNDDNFYRLTGVLYCAECDEEISDCEAPACDNAACIKRREDDNEAVGLAQQQTGADAWAGGFCSTH